MPVPLINAGDVPSQNKMTGAWRRVLFAPAAAATGTSPAPTLDDAAESSPATQTPPTETPRTPSSGLDFRINPASSMPWPRNLRISPFSAGVNLCPESHLPYQFVPFRRSSRPHRGCSDAWFAL